MGSVIAMKGGFQSYRMTYSSKNLVHESRQAVLHTTTRIAFNSTRLNHPSVFNLLMT